MAIGDSPVGGGAIGAAPIGPSPPPPPPFVPPFPPLQQTSSCSIIPSYLYEQYFDDDDLQAFVRTFNAMAQDRASWFCGINLPIYTGAQISDGLLDWVADGLYGLRRPALAIGSTASVGPLNTWMLNTIQLDRIITTGSISTFAVNDDIFKRILTWHFYKGDGKTFSIQWLKRRVMRFLIGTNGISPNVSDTRSVSVTQGPDNDVTITIMSGGIVSLPVANIFQAAVASAAVELPFQFDFSVVVI